MDGGLCPADSLRPSGYQYDRTAIGGLPTWRPVLCRYLILNNLRVRIFEQIVRIKEPSGPIHGQTIQGSSGFREEPAVLSRPFDSCKLGENRGFVW